MNFRRLTRPPDLRGCQSIRCRTPALKHLPQRKLLRRAMSAVGLGRVKTPERQELVEGCSSPEPMTTGAMASRLGMRGTGRTRFPSVNVISGFSHGQGQL